MVRLGLLFLFCAGCTATTAASKPAAPVRPVRIVAVPVDSPLGGAPLVLSRVGDAEIEGMPPDKCSFWPILDTYKLIADANRVCVSVELFQMNTESGALPISKVELGLSSAAQPPTFFEVTAAGMKKAGRCYGKDALRTTVWKYQFVGCTPNQGLVTEYTQSLLLRQKEGEEIVRWSFRDAKAAPASVAAAQPQPQPQPQPAPSNGEFTPTPFPTAQTRPPGPPPPPPPQPVAGPPPRPQPAAPQPSPQARLLYQQGAQLLAQRYYGDAMEKFSQCLDLEPALAVGYVARGNALLGLRRYVEASADYAYALELDPGSAMPLYGLAETAKGLNDVRKARAYYQRFLDSRAPDASPAMKADVSRKLGALP